MQKELLLVAVFALSVVNGTAQNAAQCKDATTTTDLSRFELCGRVKTVVVNYFQSQKISSDNDISAKPVFSEKINFDEKGFLTRYENQIDTTLTITANHAVCREYEGGKVKRVSAKGYHYEIEHDTIMGLTHIYEYQDNTDSLISVLRLTYNSASQLTEEMQCDNQMKLLWLKRWTYNDNGQAVTYFEEKWNELFPILVRTDYDENGNITRKYDAETKVSTSFVPIKEKTLYYLSDTNLVNTSSHANKQIQIEMEQILDEQGNWILREIKNYDRGMKMTTQRIIDYHSTK